MREGNVAALEDGIRGGKGGGAKFHITCKRSNMHAPIVADDKTLNCALLGVVARVDGD